MLRKPVPVIFLLLMFTLMAFLPGAPAGGCRIAFLNDRAADIVGARPLEVKGFAVPGGLTGEGQIVGLADSGLDGGRVDDIHPDLQDIPGRMPKIVMLKSWSGRAVPDDPVGHGTHMAATIAGTGAASGGKYRGMAPEAGIYFQAILNNRNEPELPADLFDLFQPAYDAGVRIHVDGWGGGPNAYGRSTAQIDEFVRQRPDFLAIFGAGNGGPAAGTLTGEANSKNALVMGAGEDPRPAFVPDAAGADRAAVSSSRGPAAGGRLKPDLLAPASAVVSAASRLVQGNFPANPLYTRMGGTSMAAAVAGGASALLREYFLKEENMAGPSASLMKAALINGARPLEGGPSKEGFGVIDLAGTVLALREKTFNYVDNRSGLKDGESLVYQYRVADPKTPLKVTLAWTDPASSGSLVNNLDLTVTGPGGKEYYGNHFLHPGRPDRENNVEQVYIPSPPPGVYTVIIRGAGITESVVAGSPAPAQDFALVYGQPLYRGIIAEVAGKGEFLAADGRFFAMPADKIKSVADGRLLTAGAGQVEAGSDLYLGLRGAYTVSSAWKAGGVQAVPAGSGLLFVEANARVREGGFYLNPAAKDSLWLNGARVSDAGDIPPGVEVVATLNPSTQTLWQVKAFYEEKEGFLDRVDVEARQIRLLGDTRSYRLAPQAAVSFLDRTVNAGPADAPYGSGEAASLDRLLPGLSVRLIISPFTGEVLYMAVKRQVALGRTGKIDLDQKELTLGTGAAYELLPGISVRRDGAKATPAELREGDYLIALLLPGEKKIIGLTAFSNVTFGRVLYFSEKQKSLYLIDCFNRFRMFSVPGDAAVFRWNISAETATLAAGDWVRVFLDPSGKEVRRLDIAEVAGEVTGLVDFYDPAESILYLFSILPVNDGVAASNGGSLYPETASGQYKLDPETLVVKNGYRVRPEDLVFGDKATTTLLEAPSRDKFVVSVTAETGRQAAPPELAVSSVFRGRRLVIAGIIGGDRLYLYRENGSREEAPVAAGGRFTVRLDLVEGERSVQLVAVDKNTGGVAGRQVTLPEPVPVKFIDLSGSRDEAVIAQAAEQGLVDGYPDGTFRPGAPVTRLEFTVMLARALGWLQEPAPAPSFADAGSIPSWAVPAVAAAQEKGLVIGYPDGTFRPGRAITRAEAAVMVSRALAVFEQVNAVEELPFLDQGSLPSWARDAVARSFISGVLIEKTPGFFFPGAVISRAEAAGTLSRLIERLVQ